MVPDSHAPPARGIEAPALVAEVRGTRAGLIVLVGVLALNLGNAVFHLLGARLLGPSQYGDVVSLVAASGLLALPFGGVQYGVARFVSDDAARGDAEAVAEFVRRTVFTAIAFGSALTLALVAASPLVRDALGVHKLSPVVLTALYTLPALAAPALWGVAQGLQRFALISGSLVAGSLLRIVVVLALIPFGVGVGSVMGATLLGGFASIVVPLPFIWSWLRRPRARHRARPSREVLAYLVPVVGGTLAITSLTTVDLIAAKIALPSYSAGIYGAASFIGRLLLYLPTTIAMVLLPKVTSRAAVAEDTSEILHASIAVTTAFSLCGTLLLVAAPHLVIDLTFGSKYTDAAPLIGLFGLAMTLYAILNVQLVYHLGHGRKGMALLLLGGAVAQIALYGAVHGSTYQLVGSNLATAVGLLIVHEVAFARTLPGAFAWAVHMPGRVLRADRRRRYSRAVAAGTSSAPAGPSLPPILRSIWPPRRRDLVALALCLGVTVFWFYRLVLHLGGAVLYAPNDESYSIRLYWAAIHYHSTPFTLHRDILNGWPEGLPIATAVEWANMIIPGVIWVLHYPFGLTVAENLFLLGGFVLTGFAVYLFLTRLGFDLLPTAFAIYAITFNPWMFYRAGAGHHGFMQVWVFVLEIVALLNAHRRQTLTSAAIAGLSVTLAFYESSYYGLMAGVIFFVFWLVDLARRQTWHERIWSFTLFDTAIAAALVAFIPAFVAWWEDRRAVAAGVSNGISQLQAGGAAPQSYFLPALRNPVLGTITRHLYPRSGFDWSENTLYLGWTLIALSLAGLVLVIRKHHETLLTPTRRYLLVCLSVLVPVAFLFSMKRVTAGVPMPSWFIGHITAFWRVYARFAVIVLFALAILSALTLQVIVRRYRWGRFVAVAAVALLVLEYLPGIPTVYRLDTRPAWAQWLKRQPFGSVAHYPLPTDKPQALILLAQTYFLQTYDEQPNFMPFGSGTGGTREDAIRVLARYVDIPTTPSILKAEHVRYVLLHDDVYRAQGEQPPPIPYGFHLVASLPGHVRALEIDKGVKAADLPTVLEQNALSIAATEGLEVPWITYSGFAGATATSPGTLRGEGMFALHWTDLRLRRVQLFIHAYSPSGARKLEIADAHGDVLAQSLVGTNDTEIVLGPVSISGGDTSFVLRTDPSGPVTVTSLQVRPVADFSVSLRSG